MTNEDLHSNGTSARHRMFSLIWPGALAAQAIYCAAKLGVADLVADGVDNAECLAAATKTHPLALRRLLRGLCSLGVLTELETGSFALTDMGRTLQVDDSSGVYPWAVLLGAPFVWRPWGRLLETIQTGEAAFARIFGRPFEQLKTLSPEDAEIYQTAINAGANNEVPAILSAYDFSQFDLVVDVGGGNGQLLWGILETSGRPRGVLFDRADVVASVTPPYAHRIPDRCQIVEGSFFDPLPVGADAYILRGVLHSQGDDDAVRILENIRRVMHVDGKVLIMDVVLKPCNEPSPHTALMDLMMLALTPGLERTETEFATLLRRAGLEMSRVIPMDSCRSIVEAAPRSVFAGK